MKFESAIESMIGQIKLQRPNACAIWSQGDMVRVGTKKMTIIDFPEILPLCLFESESNEFYGYSYIEVIVFMLSMIVISNIFSHLLY